MNVQSLFRASWRSLLLAWSVTSCSLGEVVEAEGGDVLVVESYLQAGGTRQAVLLHRSLQGGIVQGEPGASVTLLTPDGGATELVEAPPEFCVGTLTPEMTDSLQVAVSCYGTPTSDASLILPGATYELEVLTSRGERIRGRTTVPGAFQGRRPLIPSASFPACALPPRTNVELMWTQSEGAWSYLATIEITGLRGALSEPGIDAPERVDLTGIAISQSDTTLVLPAEFGLFDFGNVSTELLVYLQGGFPPGVSVRMRLSALDRNYVNAVRGGSFNPSGAVRISSVVGDGVGVFGSYVSRDLFIVVEEDSPLQPC